MAETSAGLRIAANISMLFTELPFLQRPAAAAAAGFGEIEFWWPFDQSLPSAHDARDLAAAIQKAGVRVALMNVDVGPDVDACGMVSLSAHRELFTANLDIAVQIASLLEIPAINVPYGNIDPRVSAATQRTTAIGGLTFAADAAAAVGATIVVEAVNRIENPSYALTGVEDVVTLIGQVQASTGREIKLQFDAYHAAMGGEDPVKVAAAVMPAIGHVQLADWPGRAQPGTGRLDWQSLLELLSASRYAGAVGLEYIPTPNTSASLSWLEDHELQSHQPRTRGRRDG